MPDNIPEEEMQDKPNQSEQAAGGEYGLGQILVDDEEALERAQEEGEYHYSQDELEHKEDRTDR